MSKNNSIGYDITFCINDNCKRNKECYRYIKNHEITDRYVSMAVFEDEDCDRFIQI